MGVPAAQTLPHPRRSRRHPGTAGHSDRIADGLPVAAPVCIRRTRCVCRSPWMAAMPFSRPSPESLPPRDGVVCRGCLGHVRKDGSRGRHESGSNAPSAGRQARGRRHGTASVGKRRIRIRVDRREDPGTRRLARRDARAASRLDPGSRPRSRRGMEVARHAGLVAPRPDLHRRDIQARGEDDLRQGRLLADPSDLFNASLEGNTRRAIDFHEGDAPDEDALKALIRAAVAFNQASRRKHATGDGR